MSKDAAKKQKVANDKILATFVKIKKWSQKLALGSIIFSLIWAIARNSNRLDSTLIVRIIVRDIVVPVLSFLGVSLIEKHLIKISAPIYFPNGTKIRAVPVALAPPESDSTTRTRTSRTAQNLKEEFILPLKLAIEMDSFLILCFWSVAFPFIPKTCLVLGAAILIWDCIKRASQIIGAVHGIFGAIRPKSTP